MTKVGTVEMPSFWYHVVCSCAIEVNVLPYPPWYQVDFPLLIMQPPIMIVDYKEPTWSSDIGRILLMNL